MNEERRLAAEDARRLDRLCAENPGLPRAEVAAAAARRASAWTLMGALSN